MKSVENNNRHFFFRLFVAIDFSVPLNTPILASGAGVVTHVGIPSPVRRFSMQITFCCF
jgi:hypothetical protein